MATSGEATAIKVALISMVSAILVALIANADKFVPKVPPAPTTAVAAPPPSETIVAEPAPPRVEARVTAEPAPRTQPPIVVREAPAPPRPVPDAAPALAPGDRRLIAAWGRSNDGVERRFIMRNDTSQPMVRLFVSSADDSADGPDRLGGVAVPPGVSISVDADDGTKRCTFDMRVVFADGRELVQNNFDVCSGVNFMWQFGGERR